MNIRSATFQLSAPDLASCPEPDLPEFALVGRSNVGKSSLVNMLVGGKALARVSATPGHTRLMNFFSVDGRWRLVDLPGYGFAQTGKGQRHRFQELIVEYLIERSNLACVLVLIDSRHPPQKIDLEFLQWLMEEGAPHALVFTKIDRTKPNQLKNNIALFEAEIAAWGQELPPVLTCSAETKSGRPQLLSFIGQTMRDVLAAAAARAQSQA